MSINFETRTVESAQAAEIFISAVPAESAPLKQQAKELFSGICRILTSKGADILQERIFATQNAMETISAIRSKAYGEIDDGVAPSLLVCKEGILGPIAGVQIHAVRSGSHPEVLNVAQKPCGRILRAPGWTYLTLSNISAPEHSQAGEQARAMLEKSESVLKQFGHGIKSVPRTWMWLGDILSWYDEFNQVRNSFFVERGDWPGASRAGVRQTGSAAASTSGHGARSAGPRAV